MSGGLLSRADKFPWSLNCYLEFLSRGLRHDYSIWQLVQNLSLRQRMFIRFLVPVWRLYYTVPNWDGVSSQSEPLIRWSDLQSDREKHGVRKPLRGNPDYTPFNQFRSRAQRTSGIIAERMTEKFGRSASYNVQFLRGGGGRGRNSIERRTTTTVSRCHRWTRDILLTERLSVENTSIPQHGG